MTPTRNRTARKTPLNQDPEAVRWARRAKGWTQRGLADAVEIAPSHLCEIERGTRNAPPHLINKLARALNCPVSVLERKRTDSAVA